MNRPFLAAVALAAAICAGTAARGQSPIDPWLETVSTSSPLHIGWAENQNPTLPGKTQPTAEPPTKTQPPTQQPVMDAPKTENHVHYHYHYAPPAQQQAVYAQPQSGGQQAPVQQAVVTSEAEGVVVPAGLARKVIGNLGDRLSRVGDDHIRIPRTRTVKPQTRVRIFKETVSPAPAPAPSQAAVFSAPPPPAASPQH